MITKGEWMVEGDCYIIAGEEYKHSLIADIATANDNYEANAHLIAAAPDMYEALIWFQEWNGNRKPDGEKPNRADVARKVKQALSKANGE